MLKDCNWSSDRDYKSGSSNEPLQFYLEGLTNSNQFDLLLGYFSSSAIHLLSLGFASFISNGGNMRIVINHLLSSNDKEAILKAEEDDYKVFDLTNPNKLLTVLNDYDKHFFECITYLIYQKRIQIKVIKPKDSNGIAHYKSGVFSDGSNSVGYKASCNFTLYGLSENLEELEAFLDWEGDRSEKLINKQKKIIDRYFNEEDRTVDYLKTEDIEAVLRKDFGNKDLSELVVQEEDLIRKIYTVSSNSGVRKTIEKIQDTIRRKLNTPRFPYDSGPRDYQKEAYNSWVNNGYKGLFAMATGTGKTITSLNCLLNEWQKKNSYRAVILVPTIPLLKQWKEECRKFNFSNIISISSREKWDKELSFFNTASHFIETSYIVIVTYASFPNPKFQTYFQKLPSDTILIADETHNLGSKRILKTLDQIHLQKRIGLSATPKRMFDEVGNEAIENFFNDKPPFIVSYTMEKALETNALCPYTYYPHIVTLTGPEMEKYQEISAQLVRMGLFDSKTGLFRSTPEIEMKLLERKRVIHKAENKLDKFREILKEEYQKRGSLKYTLVYVPEGVESSFHERDFSLEDDEEIRLINDYTRAISSTSHDVLVKQFTGKTKNREEILYDFATGNLHVLASMKCLDEGVDVPRSELAIFCSSTGNPRQFIQRRGRVLRNHPDKSFATIHDLVVVPDSNYIDSSFEMERRLLLKELERVVDFSNLAMNKSETYDRLHDVITYYNINLNDI
jgi:superfamily II DNA or RNA helicase